MLTVGKQSCITWWESLTLTDKQKYKDNYEKVLNSKNNFPNMKDTTSTRISQLTQNQIHCIWRFKERIENPSKLTCKECGETFVDNKSGWKSITTAKELLYLHTFVKHRKK